MYRLDYYDKKRFKEFEKIIKKSHDKNTYYKLLDYYEELKEGNVVGVKQEENYKKYKKFIDKENLDEALGFIVTKEGTIRYEVEISSDLKIDSDDYAIRSYQNKLFLIYDVCETDKTIYLKNIVLREVLVQSVENTLDKNFLYNYLNR